MRDVRTPTRQEACVPAGPRLPVLLQTLALTTCSLFLSSLKAVMGPAGTAPNCSKKGPNGPPLHEQTRCRHPHHGTTPHGMTHTMSIMKQPDGCNRQFAALLSSQALCRSRYHSYQ